MLISGELDLNWMCDGCKGDMLVKEPVADSTHDSLMEMDDRPGELVIPQDITYIWFSFDAPS